MKQTFQTYIAPTTRMILLEGEAILNPSTGAMSTKVGSTETKTSSTELTGADEYSVSSRAQEDWSW